MATYQELKQQAQELLAQAEKIRQQEKGQIITELRAKMVEYGITPADLQTRGRRQGVARAKGEAQYRGPNGETWSGGPGRKPDWVRAVIAAGGNIEDYRINKQEEVAA